MAEKDAAACQSVTNFVDLWKEMRRLGRLAGWHEAAAGSGGRAIL
jgi:hypothetical protein